MDHRAALAASVAPSLLGCTSNSRGRDWGPLCAVRLALGFSWNMRVQCVRHLETSAVHSQGDEQVQRDLETIASGEALQVVCVRWRKGDTRTRMLPLLLKGGHVQERKRLTKCFSREQREEQ